MSAKRGRPRKTHPVQNGDVTWAADGSEFISHEDAQKIAEIAVEHVAQKELQVTTPKEQPAQQPTLHQLLGQMSDINHGWHKP